MKVAETLPLGLGRPLAGRMELGELALLAGLYFVLALISIGLALQPGAIADVWFPNVVAIAVLAGAPRSRWAALLLAVAGANFAANVALRGAPLLSASFVPGNLAEIVLGAWLLQRFDLARSFDEGGGEFLAALAAGGLVPQLLGATIGATLLHVYGFANFQAAWPSWYVDSTIGALALLPLSLALRRAGGASNWRHLTAVPALVFLVLAAFSGWLAFLYLPQPYAFVALPLVLSVFFLTPVATFGLAFVLVLSVSAGHDLGWFVALAAGSQSRNWHIYLPMAAAVVPAQLLAVVMHRMRTLQQHTDALTMVGNDVAVVIDRAGMVRGVNQAFEILWGRKRSTLIGSPFAKAAEPRYAAIAQQRFEHVLKTGKAIRVRSELLTALGPRVLDVEYLPLRDPTGQVSGTLYSTHDVTELVAVQRELERNLEQLRAANEGLQQFVRIASHDMREPLNTVIQFTGLIEKDPSSALSAAGRQYFGQVRGGAQRMRTLLDDVLSFARLDHADTMPLRPVALSAVLATVQDTLGSSIAERHARIDVAALPVVVGHESLLVLLFQNLLSNGIKFTPAERAPRLSVSVHDEGEFLAITVADQGIGIAAEDLPQLFVPFKRLHTRRQYDGTGLGLAICQRIVGLMGGTIALESEPGLGTRALVRLRRSVFAG